MVDVYIERSNRQNGLSIVTEINAARAGFNNCHNSLVESSHTKLPVNGAVCRPPGCRHLPEQCSRRVAHERHAEVILAFWTVGTLSSQEKKRGWGVLQDHITRVTD